MRSYRTLKMLLEKKTRNSSLKLSNLNVRLAAKQAMKPKTASANVIIARSTVIRNQTAGPKQRMKQPSQQRK